LSRALVTGGAGFLGSNLVEYLTNRGLEVIVLDDLTTGSMENLRHVRRDRMRVVNIDVRKTGAILEYFQDVDVVFHLAALAGVKLATRSPLRTLDNNIQTTRSVLEACSSAGVQRLVFASSSEVYGETSTCPMNENVPLSPISSYGVSKITGEFYCMAFQKKYGIRVSIVRYFNVYGPRQSAKMKSWVVPAFISNVIEKRPLIVHGQGDQTRDFTYIDDAVKGTYLVGTRSYGHGEIFNIGTGIETSVLDLARLILSVTKSSNPIIHTRPRRFHISRRCADISKARSELGYSPSISLKSGVKRTYEFFRKSYHGKMSRQ